MENKSSAEARNMSGLYILYLFSIDEFKLRGFFTIWLFDPFLDIDYSIRFLPLTAAYVKIPVLFYYENKEPVEITCHSWIFYIYWNK